MICKYVDQVDLAAMLSAKRSAGFTQEMNLRNPLHAAREANKAGIHLDFET